MNNVNNYCWMLLFVFFSLTNAAHLDKAVILENGTYATKTAIKEALNEFQKENAPSIWSYVLNMKFLSLTVAVGTGYYFRNQLASGTQFKKYINDFIARIDNTTENIEQVSKALEKNNKDNAEVKEQFRGLAQLCDKTKKKLETDTIKTILQAMGKEQKKLLIFHQNEFLNANKEIKIKLEEYQQLLKTFVRIVKGNKILLNQVNALDSKVEVIGKKQTEITNLMHHIENNEPFDALKKQLANLEHETKNLNQTTEANNFKLDGVISKVDDLKRRVKNLQDVFELLQSFSNSESNRQRISQDRPAAYLTLPNFSSRRYS